MTKERTVSESFAVTCRWVYTALDSVEGLGDTSLVDNYKFLGAQGGSGMSGGVDLDM